MNPLSASPPDRTIRRLALLATAGWVAGIILIGYVALTSWPQLPYRVDFISFWTGGYLVRDGHGAEMFDLDAQQLFRSNLRPSYAATEKVPLGREYLPYISLPPMALPYLPLTLFTVPQAYLIWWVLNYGAFALAIALSLRGQPFARAWAVLMLAFGAVTSTLYEGQVYALFLLALSLAIWALRSDRPLVAGLLLGALWTKPQYGVVFLLVFLVKGRWREFAGMVAAGLVVLILSVAMVGFTGAVRYMALLKELGSFGDWSVNPQAMVNWRAFLVNLDPHMPDVAGSLLVLALGGLTVLLSLLAWRGEWDPLSERFSRQMLVAVIATLVASPHSHFHGLVLLFAPLSYLLPTIVKGRGMDSALRLVLLAGYILASVAWVFVRIRWLSMPLLVIAMAILLLQGARTERVAQPS